MLDLTKVLALTALLFNTFILAAQTGECDARESFLRLYDLAKPALPEQKCVQIDATASYDSAGAELELHWDLGDGAKAKGLKARHCYGKPGLYQAVLSVLTSTGDTISANEMTLEVVIKEAVSLSLQIPGAVAVDSAFSAAVAVSELISYSLENIYLDFGDGSFACGNDLTHRYEMPGRYTVRALLTLSAPDGEFYLKAEQSVYVEGFNLDAQEWHRYFENYHASVARYTDEPVRLCLLNEATRKAVVFRELRPDRFYSVYPPQDSAARIFIWKGSLLAAPVALPAFGDSAQALIYIQQALKNNLQKPPLILKPVYFGLNAYKPDIKNRRILQENAAILQALPGAVVVRIGSYTHSGGMRDIVESYADARSEYIKNELQKRLPASVELRVDSARNTPSLVNTCFDNPECGIENKELNGRSDIKIISIGEN